MPRKANYASPLVAFGGIGYVATVWMAASFIEESQECGTAQPNSCSFFESAPEGALLQERDGNLIEAYKTGITLSSIELKDYRPEYAYTYEACSNQTGTGLKHGGTEATNQWCLALGCNWKQCVQKRLKCRQDDGTVDPGYLENGVEKPDVFCVAAKLKHSIHPGKFCCILFAYLIAHVTVGLGCAGGNPQDHLS